MNSTPALPELSTREVVLQMIASLVYLSVAAAAVGQAPRDRRTQVFFAFATVSAIAFVIPVCGWYRLLDISPG